MGPRSTQQCTHPANTPRRRFPNKSSRVHAFVPGLVVAQCIYCVPAQSRRPPTVCSVAPPETCLSAMHPKGQVQLAP